MWASRYNLFVLWSADRQHPWDSADSAEEIAATLEIGKLAGTDDEIVVLLDGERIKKFSFTNGIFTTKCDSLITPAMPQQTIHSQACTGGLLFR